MEEVQLNKNISITVLQHNREQGHRKHFFTVKIQTLGNRCVAVTVNHVHLLFRKPWIALETHCRRGSHEEEVLSQGKA